MIVSYIRSNCLGCQFEVAPVVYDVQHSCYKLYPSILELVVGTIVIISFTQANNQRNNLMVLSILKQRVTGMVLKQKDNYSLTSFPRSFLFFYLLFLYQTYTEMDKHN